MKKITSLFLVIAMLISLLWCNPEDIKAAEPDVLNTETQETNDTSETSDTQEISDAQKISDTQEDETEPEYDTTEINEEAVVDDTAIENSADEADISNDFEVEEIQEAYVDPLFADVIPETEADIVLEKAKYAYENQISLYSVSSPMSYDEAMDYIRECMIDRVPSVSVQFKVAPGTKIELSEYMADIYDDYSSSVSGDYLHFHTFASGYSGKLYTYDDSSVYDLTFAFTYFTTAEQEDALTVSLNETMNNLKLSSLNEYEKTKRIYDYITSNVVYNYDANNAALEYSISKDKQVLAPYMTAWSAYGAQNEKNCVCQGYANLFYRMTFEAGVSSRIIAGTGNGGAHAWNIVGVGGQYYNVDSTWDAGRTTYRYFLRSSNDFAGHVRDAEYDTADFAATYPMASSNFDLQAYKASLAPNFTNIVVCAYFQDDTEGKVFFETGQGGFQFAPTQKNAFKIWDMYNGTSKRSVTNYLNTISYGKLRINNILPQYSGDGAAATIVPLKLPYNMSQADNGNIDGHIIQYALNNITIPDTVNLDVDNDGFVDNLTIILKGGDGNSKSGTSLVCHKSDFGDPSIKLNGKSIGTYNMLNTYSISLQESAVISHEFLHSLGFTDLYNSTDVVGPVYVWDMMASANIGMSWPLAYTRMCYTDWVDIDTVTQSTSLTLDLQSKKGGNAAYILKSPLNDQEFFVVEFRKRSSGVDDLDRHIGYSGVIVYRVDTTVDGLSNHYGETAIYVFRPDLGNGYDDQQAIMYAALSVENGRTSIGSSDMDATLDDGALTFSDGSNSGIVISNVSSSSGDQMTLDVKIPDKSELDVWENINLPDNSSSNSKYIDIDTYNSTPVVVTQDGQKLNTYQYYNNAWSSIATETSLPEYVSKVQLANYNGTLYLAYSDYSKLYILRYDEVASCWKTEYTINDCNGSFDFEAFDDGLRMAYTDASYVCHLGMYISGSYVNYGIYHTGLCGQPRVVKGNDGVYVAVRAADNVLHLYKQTDTGFSKVKEMPAAVYDMIIYNDALYVVSKAESNGNYSVSSYDKGTWKTVNSSVGGYETNLIVHGGSLYLLTSADEGTKLYRYDANADNDNEVLVKEGSGVDGTVRNQSLIAVGDNIYVAMVRQTDVKFIVRTKLVGEGNTEPDNPTEQPDNPTEQPDNPTVQPDNPVEKISVKSITLSQNNITFDWGPSGTSTLMATVAPADATNKALTWTSDNPSVATVNWHGVITPVSAGTATITCQATDGSGVNASCKVTVVSRTDVERFVIRLYDKCLGRLPDNEGISTWTNILYRKTGTGAYVAKGFVYSKEYINKNTSDEEYVEMLYRVFLDREADADGKDFWVDLLNQGMSRDFVFRGFVESVEYTGICNSYGIERGSVTLTQPRDKNINTTKFVNRLYVYVLGRRGEQDGLNDWCEAIQTKKMTPEQVGEFFVLSDEFKQKNVSDEEYVKILYRTFLGREYDTEGMNTWLNLLRNGTSRDIVLRGFTRSTEFKIIIKSFGL